MPIAIWILCLVSIAPAQELESRSMKWGGKTRSYLLYDPPGRARPGPVVFLLHGAGGDGLQMARTRLHEFGAKEGFVTVYPNGYMHNWNDGRGIPRWPAHKENVDDIGFFRAVIDYLVTKRGVDSRRVYFAGISNGGLMSHRLGCELAGNVTAIAPVVRTLTVKLAESCQPARPLPVLLIFGTADQLVPFDGGAQHIAGMEIPVLSANETVKKWATLNGCEPSPEVRTQGRVTESSFDECAERAEVRAFVIAGGGHSFPRVDVLDWKTEMWRFFREQRSPDPSKKPEDLSRDKSRRWRWIEALR